jgi:hypothetical protein
MASGVFFAFCLAFSDPAPYDQIWNGSSTSSLTDLSESRSNRPSKHLLFSLGAFLPLERTMPPKNQPPDSAISKNVSRQLASCGLRAPCQVHVQTRKGEVTLTGFVIYAHQKASALQVIQKVEGVRRVIDQMKIRPPVKHDYKTLPPLPKPAVAEPAGEQAEAAGDSAASCEANAEAAAPATAEAAPRAEEPSKQTAAQPILPEVLSDSTEFELGPVPVVRRHSSAPAHE